MQLSQILAILGAGSFVLGLPTTIGGASSNENLDKRETYNYDKYNGSPEIGTPGYDYKSYGAKPGAKADTPKRDVNERPAPAYNYRYTQH